MATTKKFTPEIDATLYKELTETAERNGQTKRYVLEEALRFYLHHVVPSQHVVRREVMDAFEESVTRNRELLERLAK
jgi:predicted transcriptional regulator